MAPGVPGEFEASSYKWCKQRVERAEINGLSTDQALELGVVMLINPGSTS